MQHLLELGAAGKLPQLFLVQVEKFNDKFEGCVLLKDSDLN
jgi:hypothetical protein